MKNLLLIPICLFFVGCEAEKHVTRDQMHLGYEAEKHATRDQMYLGMSLGQAWMAYSKQIPETVSDEINGHCTTTIYRFWLWDDVKSSDKINLHNLAKAVAVSAEGVNDPQFYTKQKPHPSPYLLTFLGCRNENYAAIIAERKARSDSVLAGNPQLAQEMEKFSHEQHLNPENRETLLEMMYPDVFAGLPRPSSEPQLTNIDVDYQMLDRSSQKDYRDKTLQLQQQQLNLQQEQLDEIQRQNLMNRH